MSTSAAVTLPEILAMQRVDVRSVERSARGRTLTARSLSA